MTTEHDETVSRRAHPPAEVVGDDRTAAARLPRPARATLSNATPSGLGGSPGPVVDDAGFAS